MNCHGKYLLYGLFFKGSFLSFVFIYRGCSESSLLHRLSLDVVWGLLTVLASVVAEHRLQARRLQ